jgi:hypothetical protein
MHCVAMAIWNGVSLRAIGRGADCVAIAATSGLLFAGDHLVERDDFFRLRSLAAYRHLEVEYPSKIKPSDEVLSQYQKGFEDAAQAGDISETDRWRWGSVDEDHWLNMYRILTKDE